MSKLFVLTRKQFAFVALLIYPIVSLPMLLSSMIERKKWAFVMFAVFMGYVGFLYPPFGDFYRYSLVFDGIKDMNWEDLKNYLQLNYDYFFILVSFCCSKLDLSVEWVRLIFNVLGYFIIFDMFRMVIGYNPIFQEKKIYLCAFVILIPFSLHGFLYRWGLASAFLLNGCVRWFYFSQKRGLLLMFLGVFVHLSILLFLILSIVAKKIPLNLNFYALLFIILISFVLDSGSVAQYILAFLPFDASLVDHIYQYIDGSQSGNITEGYSTIQLIMYVIYSLSNGLWFFAYLIFYKKNREKSPMMNFVNYLFVLLLLVASFPIVYSRFLGLTISFMKIIIFMNISYLIIDYVWYKRLAILTFCLLIVSFVQMYRYPLMFGYEYKLLTSSSFGILTSKYTDEWISENVNNGGDLIKKYE